MPTFFYNLADYTHQNDSPEFYDHVRGLITSELRNAGSSKKLVNGTTTYGKIIDYILCKTTSRLNLLNNLRDGNLLHTCLRALSMIQINAMKI